MRSDEITYLQRRAAQHRACAKRAATPEVAAIHAVLVEGYLEALIAIARPATGTFGGPLNRAVWADLVFSSQQADNHQT